MTDAAIATIRERIETSVYPVGSLLPAQRQLSEELAISRASLREALSTLEALGMLHISPGKGVYVNSAQAAGTHAWRFADQASLPDTYQMRFALEGFVARLAAPAIGDADIVWLEDNLVALDDLSRFESDLKDEWERQFELMKLQLPANADHAAQERAGQDLFQLVTEQLNLRLRAYDEPFFTRGKFHELADNGRVGWHPDFESRLATLLLGDTP